jgi:sulfite exporter TauE/SafE
VIIAETHLIGGALMGMASSLHCAGICGGIASSLLLATSAPAASEAETSALFKIQIGRALSYTLCGALVGGGGAAFAGLLALAGAQQILRVLAACTLVWAGCSIAGFGRSLPAFDRALAAIVSPARWMRAQPFAAAHPVAMGVAWGFAPCGMVYAALLNAMMAGSVSGGAQFMAGFGLVTIPAVASAAFGVTGIARLGIRAQRATLRKILGAAILVLGLISLAEPAESVSALCLSR